MKVLKILTIPADSELLAKTSIEISKEELLSSDFAAFLDDLILTAKTARTPEGWRSAGLAAIQVGKAWRVFVAQRVPTEEFDVYINSKLEYLGEAKDIRQECCLSIPGFLGEVERFKRVRITYLDRNGVQHVDKEDGFKARILQHEYDHLEGILFSEKAK